jgi:hypothetical protein
MANLIPNAFKGELLSGTHNFSSGGNDFKLALYTGSISSTYTTSTTTYQTNNEVSTANSSNYTTTGKVLQNQSVTTGATSFVDFDDLTFQNASFSATYGAIYNDTNGDKLCVVLDFNGSKTATNGDFKIVFPATGTPGNAIISVTS